MVAGRRPGGDGRPPQDAHSEAQVDKETKLERDFKTGKEVHMHTVETVCGRMTMRVDGDTMWLSNVQADIHTCALLLALIRTGACARVQRLSTSRPMQHRLHFGDGARSGMNLC